VHRKVLSYCLFEPKTMPQHRFWDKDMSDKRRYWFNLPALAIINNILYPDYMMKVYVSKNVWDNELSEALKILSDEIETFNFETIDMDYSLTEPAVWRMMPLWSRDVEVLHTRDLDSLPGEVEYSFVRSFEKSECSLGTLRAHENHYGVKCRMLAGLSSFKPQGVPVNMKWDSFNTYYAMRHNGYGSDQDLMVQRFTTDHDYTKDNFLDHRSHRQKNSQDFPCVELNSSAIEEIEISDDKREIFDFLVSCNLDNWAGEPIDSRGEYLDSLLQNPEFKNVDRKLRGNKSLASFYIKKERDNAN